MKQAQHWRWVILSAAAIILLANTPALRAVPISDMTLHVCGNISSTVCAPDSVVGGVTIGVGSDASPDFQIVRSPNNNTRLNSASITIVVLVPNDTAANGGLSFTVTGTNTGIPGPVAASLFPGTAWTTPGTALITDYLGLTQIHGPTNPLEAFLPATQTLAADATGYYVYRANMGSVNFSSSTDPSFSIGSDLPSGAVILAYLLDNSGPTFGEVSDSTANSSSLLINGSPPPTPVPEPASLVLIGSGLLSLGIWARRRQSGCATQK